MIIMTRPVIGEELEDCQEESMTVVETLMVEGEVEECDEVMESVCDTEYTQECDCSQSEQCQEVLELVDITIILTMFSPCRSWWRSALREVLGRRVAA